MTALRPGRHAFLPRYVMLLAGEAVSKLCVFGAFMYLARVLGPGGFGRIEFALSLTVFFSLGVESGLGTYAARRVSLQPERVDLLLARVMVLRAALAVPGYLAIWVIAGSVAPELGTVLRVYGLLVFAAPFFTHWVFQGLQQMQWVAVGMMLRGVSFLVLVLLFVTDRTAPWVVGTIELAAAAALATVNAVVLHGVWGLWPAWRDAWAGARVLFKDAWSLGASDLTWACLWYAPTVLLGTLADVDEVAWQAAAVRIVFSLHTGVWLYFFNVLPNLTTALSHSLDAWRHLLQRSVAASSWLACLLALLGTLLAGDIVTAVYGGSYVPARVPFQILVWMIPVAWLSGHFRYSLVAAGHQWWEFVASALTAAFTLVVTAALAAVAQSAGAATGLLLGGVFNLVATGILVNRTIGSPLGSFRPLFRVGLSCATCLLVGWALSPGLGTPGAGLVAGGVLGGLAFWDQRAMLRTLWHAKG